MKRKLIMVAAPPAAGKNYVSDLICRKIDGIAYLDKDDLSPLLRRAFAVAGERMDMDGSFYSENLRNYEYETLLTLAFSNLRYSGIVLVNAPFSREVRDENFMRELKKRANASGAELILVWVSVPPEICYERMRARASDRDTEKLENFWEYAKHINYTPPTSLAESSAVNRLFIFDNSDEASAAKSLEKLAKMLEM